MIITLKILLAATLLLAPAVATEAGVSIPDS